MTKPQLKSGALTVFLQIVYLELGNTLSLNTYINFGALTFFVSLNGFSITVLDNSSVT